MQFQKIVKTLKVLVMYLFSNEYYEGFLKYFWVNFQSLLGKSSKLIKN